MDAILYVRNLPFNMTPSALYELFGGCGAVYQIRVGNTKETKGTAFVMYEDKRGADTARKKLSGFAIGGRYLIVLPFQQEKAKRGTST